jgi:hypothetical protein
MMGKEQTLKGLGVVMGWRKMWEFEIRGAAGGSRTGGWES